MSLPTIRPEDAKRLMDRGATLIDIRSADERARAYIPGSQHGPLDRLGTVDAADAPIIFHCRSRMRTTSNAERLRAAAPCEAYLLESGLEGWKKAGLPVVVDARQPIEISRQVMIVAGTLVLTFVFLGAFVASGFYVLAGLIGAGLIIGGLSGWCGMAKLLALMPWNRQSARA